MSENRNRLALNRWYAAILVYVCLVYGNSLTPASISSQKSSFLLEKIQGAMESLGWEHLWLTEHIIRKTAHFAKHTVLGRLAVRTYGSYGRHRVCNRGALMLTFMVPFIDETIQIFVAGRSSQIGDAWLDMSGVIVGMTITTRMMCCLRKKRTVG